MLPKQYRLPLRSELARMKVDGKLVHANLFGLLISRQPSKNKPVVSRFGFIISTRVDKRATKRNRAKRLLTEALYRLIPKLKPGFDGIFLAKRTIVNRGLDEISQEMEAVFKKAQILR